MFACINTNFFINTISRRLKSTFFNVTKKRYKRTIEISERIKMSKIGTAKSF